MKQRSKLFLTPDHATLAIIEDQGRGRESLISSVRFPRAEFLRLAGQAVAAQAGVCTVHYGDGGGSVAGELPLQSTNPTPTPAT